MKKITLIALFGFVFLGVLNAKELVYENSIVIDMPIEKVFAVIEDFESYPKFIPEFHTKLKIISENKTGLGVRFDNLSNFMGLKTESTYEVVAYEKNRYLKLENCSQHGQTTECFVEATADGKTKYTLVNRLNVPGFVKNKIFKAFDQELKNTKNFCEKL